MIAIDYREVVAVGRPVRVGDILQEFTRRAAAQRGGRERTEPLEVGEILRMNQDGQLALR